MDLQKKLIELSEYGVSFNVANGSFVIKVKYPSNWDIIRPESEEISFYKDENDNFIYYYVAPISVDLDKVFAAIDETIDYNKEMEEKIVFFKEKLKELQEIFATESLEVLKTLEFKLKKKKTKGQYLKPTSEAEENTGEEKEYDKTGDSPKKEEKVSEIDEKINEALNN